MNSSESSTNDFTSYSNTDKTRTGENKHQETAEIENNLDNNLPLENEFENF